MATTIGTALVEILPDTSSFGPTLERDLASATKGATDELGKVEDSFDDLGAAGTKSADTISKSFSGRDLIGSAALVAGAGAALGAIGSLASASIDAASNLGESLNAVGVVFGDASQAVIDFGENAAESVGLSQRAFNEAVVPIGALLNNFGLSADEAAAATLDLAERAADMASVFNVDVSQALGAIGSGLRGETEPLRAFGVNMSEAAIQAQAVKDGLVGVGEVLDPTAKATAALSLIMEQTEAVAGDFAATSDSLANSQRILAGRFEDAQAAAGEALLPAMTALVGVASEALDIFLDLPDPIQTTVVALAGFAAVGTAGVVGVAGLVRSLGTLGIALPTLKTALSTTAAFLTGPWGVAIAAAVAGLGLMLLSTNDNEEATRAFSDALDENEGSLDRAATALARAFLAETPDAAARMNELGLTFNDLVTAITGSDEEAAAFFATLGEGLGVVDFLAAGFGTGTTKTQSMSDAIRDFVVDMRTARDDTDAFVESAVDIGLVADAADGAATSVAGIHPAALDAQLGLDFLQDSIPPLTSTIELQTEAIQGLNDAYRALVDPLFAVRDAQQAAREAQRTYDKAVREGGSTSAAATRAAFDLAEADLEVEAALLRVADEAGPAFLIQLREMRDSGSITQATFETLRDRVRGMGEAADVAADDVDTKLRPALENIDKKYEPEVVVEGGDEALTTVTDVQDRLNDLISKIWPIDIVVDVSGEKIPANVLDSGGRFGAGGLIFSGVPELFVPDFSGTAVPLTSTQVDRLISSIAVGVSGETPGSSSVTVNVAPGAIVVDRPSSTADVAAGVQRALADLARTRLARDGH